MMTSLIGSEGSVLWLVAVLLLLASGLTAALLLALRGNSAPMRADHRTPEH
ncbi:hypothetical protein [Actinoplanes auranticolor]|uniref:Uncharacterized protein n=1 Tax=Actinoplanes auranticolor TaxID=47988 RepID=A0A919SU76_9ACTN|nr:hypothetical protein [Actinoplanes auranticolor]GIM79020.1 hypothetical protein Aau02nite_83750 [Actinoplanes auranticolor]